MKRLKTGIVAVAAMTLLIGCATGFKATHDHDPANDFTVYKTFACAGIFLVVCAIIFSLIILPRLSTAGAVLPPSFVTSKEEACASMRSE